MCVYIYMYILWADHAGGRLSVDGSPVRRETGHTHKHTTRTTPHNTRHDKNNTTNDHTKSWGKPE